MELDTQDAECSGCLTCGLRRMLTVGIDVAKLKNAIAVAESGRDGEVRYFAEVDASDASMRRIDQRIAAKFGYVHFCYEAGPTGYGLYRLIQSLGHECVVESLATG